MEPTGILRRQGTAAVAIALGEGEIGRIVRFVVVGGAATLVHVGVALLSLHAMGAAPHVANLCGFLVAVVFSYTMHSRVTFRHEGASALPRFSVVALGGFLVSSGAVSAFLALGLPEGVAVPLAALVVPVASYLANRFWVFR